MKKFVALSTLVTMAVLASPAHAVDTATKQNMVNACVTQVMDKNPTDTKSAQKFCGCIVNEQTKVTQAQKDELDNWVKSGKNITENTIYQRIVGKMKACAAKV